MKALRIVHVFRAPLGGLFRHVLDLAVAQAERGHQVGLVFRQRRHERARAASRLPKSPANSPLGVLTLPIPRNPGPSDLIAFARSSHLAWPGAARRRAWPWLEGRPLRRLSAWSGDAGQAYPRLYAAWRQLSLPPGIASTLRVHDDRTRSGEGPPTFSCLKADISAGATTNIVGIDAGLRRQVPNGLREAEFEPVTPNAGRDRSALHRRVAKSEGRGHAAWTPCPRSPAHWDSRRA